ncbi:hypothetical protein RN001_010659 [Aquatica leii]|uniref:Farnesol dehydrogenase-like n=1 Tax=Aquatica leii TaxID=1421715 RepID=A0AAN7P850_9COLE|nr:hypothetical protein RN001_010659 [Aquatica leii]
MERWSGKVAIVTGASSGIGASVATRLVKAGVKVAGLARRDDRVKDLAQKLENELGQLYAFKVDIRNEDEVVKTFALIEETLGPIHILINNAGIVRDTTLIDGDAELWKEVIDTNMFGLCIATREAVRYMRKNNVDGHIVHLNSILGHTVPPVPNFNIYIGTKFGVTALTEVLRQELRAIQSRIKITSISPGAVKSEFSSLSALFTNLFNEIPLLKPEDVADAIMYALGTAPHVQIHEMIIKVVGEQF